MASGIYNRLKANVLNKIVDLEADTLKVALLNSSHSFNAAHNVWDDVKANQVTGTGYTSGGETLGSGVVTQGTVTSFDGSNVAWTSSTITASHAVIYDDTVGTKDLICSIDFGEDKVSSTGTFTISWNASGIISLT